MTQLTPRLDAELRTDTPLVFGAIAIDLPGYQVNLLDGAGFLTFGGRTFVGQDDTFGVIAGVEDLSDGTGDNAPAFSLSLIPSSDAAAATLAGPAMQGAPVLVWVGAIDAISGQPIPDPYLIFAGELDVPALKTDADGRTLDYEITSVFERLFEDDESARLSPGHHRSIFADEAGVDFVTGVDQPVYWGVAGGPANPFGNGTFGLMYNIAVAAAKAQAQ